MYKALSTIWMCSIIVTKNTEYITSHPRLEISFCLFDANMCINQSAVLRSTITDAQLQSGHMIKEFALTENNLAELLIKSCYRC